MGTARAPVVGSGAAPACSASVSKPGSLGPEPRGPGAAGLLLVLGFWQIYRRGKQCSTRRSPVSVALFWMAVVIVVLVTIFPQLITNWLAG